MRLFRICKERFSATALSGEGARLYSGRWNEAGVAMVYCASSRALAAIEFFVHLDPSVAPEDLVMVEVDCPGEMAVEEVSVGDLPARWRADEEQTAAIGSEWVRSGRTALLRVPSAVVEGEWNVLLNSAHAEFGRVRVVAQRAFRFDERMFTYSSQPI